MWFLGNHLIPLTHAWHSFAKRRRELQLGHFWRPGSPSEARDRHLEGDNISNGEFSLMSELITQTLEPGCLSSHPDFMTKLTYSLGQVT
jgi:hypothetical protein